MPGRVVTDLLGAVQRLDTLGALPEPGITHKFCWGDQILNLVLSAGFSPRPAVS